MNISLNISSIKSGISNFLGRYHFIIFFVLGASGLGVAVLLLSNTITYSDNPNGYTSTVNNVGLDQNDRDTITRLKALKGVGEETEKLPLSGRISPF